MLSLPTIGSPFGPVNSPGVCGLTQSANWLHHRGENPKDSTVPLQDSWPVGTFTRQPGAFDTSKGLLSRNGPFSPRSFNQASLFRIHLIDS